ncbi:MAG TPA: glutathione S-transferase family protein [Caulobacteraceae bacterium]|nr:glutathione S-transferase family protein [Caulobacteraceae bacterium]
MIVIHTVVGSPYGRAALIACKEKGAPHRLAPLAPGASKQPQHLARHPFGKMPAIEHDGFALYETQAIERYIDQAFPGPALTPADAKAAARMNQVIGVIDCYFFQPNAGIGLVFNRVVAPKLGLPVNEAAVQAAIPGARQCMSVLAGLIGEGPYVAGEAFSLADIHAGAQLDMFCECAEGEEMLRGTPIAPWLERLRARPSFAQTTWERLAEAA